jgi:diphthine synthase
MLILIGMGLFDENDITLRGIDEAKKSDKAYIEFYTSKWSGNLKRLEEIIGKKITELKRNDLEEKSEKILEEAKNHNVVIFIEGSPLVQTTHISLLLDAKKMKISTKVIHNASIISAVGETGLHSQKFGRYVTIPFPERTKGTLPDSIFEIIRKNQKMGLHTLCLLDIATEEKKFMFVNDALEILLNGKILTKESEVIVFAKAGSVKDTIIYGKVRKLIKNNVRDLPAAIILLGELHYTEQEFLDLYSRE